MQRWFYTFDISFIYTISHHNFYLFFLSQFFIIFIVIAITLIFRLCPNNILNTIVMHNSSKLPNCVSLIFISKIFSNLLSCFLFFSLFVFSFWFDFASSCKYCICIFCLFYFFFYLLALSYVIILLCSILLWFFTYKARFNYTSILSMQILQAIVYF